MWGGEKPKRPQLHSENYRQLGDAESRRNSSPQGSKQLVTQCQMVSLEDMQTGNTQSEHAIFRNMCASICIDAYKQ